MIKFNSALAVDRSSPIPVSRLADIGIIACFVVASVSVLTYPYRHAYDDSLFYFQIAASVAASQGSVFGAGLITNGYHPFWLLVCTGLASLAPDSSLFVSLVALTTVTLNAAVLFMLRFGLSGVISPTVLSSGLILSLPYVLFAGYGMESTVVVFWLVATLLCAIRFLQLRLAKWLIATAAAMGLCVFARLDMAIPLFPLAFYLLIQVIALRQQIGGYKMAMVTAVTVGCAPVIGWLGFNLIIFDHPVPISGLLKISNATGFGIIAMTGMQTFLACALVVSVSLLAFIGRGYAHRVILSLGLGQILYLSYLSASGQGEVYAWYFVSVALTASLCVVAALDSLAERLHGRLQLNGLRSLIVTAVAFGVMLSVLLTVRYAMRPGIDLDDFYGSESLRSVTARNGITRVLAFDRPGQLAYIDGLDVIAADGLTTSFAFQKRLSQEGISWLVKTYGIQAFVGPAEEAPWLPSLCNGIPYLGMKYRCDDDKRKFTEVEFFSRLDGKALGVLDLRDVERLHFAPNRKLGLYVLSK